MLAKCTDGQAMNNPNSDDLMDNDEWAFSLADVVDFLQGAWKVLLGGALALGFAALAASFGPLLLQMAPAPQATAGGAFTGKE